MIILDGKTIVAKIASWNLRANSSKCVKYIEKNSETSKIIVHIKYRKKVNGRKTSVNKDW